MTAKRISIAASAVALVVVLGDRARSSSAPRRPTPPALRLTLAQMRTRLAGSPAQLASLHAQASELLAGGLRALRRAPARAARTAGGDQQVGIVVRAVPAEFGVFQRVSVTRGRQVAFIGIDSGDTSRADALAFLRSSPLSYPSYYDADERSRLRGHRLDVHARHRLLSTAPDTQYIHQGPYLSAARLEQDVARYALDG